MNPIEIFVSLLAPHICMGCGRDGDPICLPCSQGLPRQAPACYRCRSPSMAGLTCQPCLGVSPLTRVCVATSYKGQAKQLVHTLKFKRAKAAAGVAARLIDDRLPPLPAGTIVSPVPTAPRRVRQRGYDQSLLIARRLSRLRRLPYCETLGRISSSRQVGAGRAERYRQLEGALYVINRRRWTGRDVLLVDDVLTTGATLGTAAMVLSSAGAGKLTAAVFAG